MTESDSYRPWTQLCLWIAQTVCLLTVFCCFSCTAAPITYFVDFDNGNDSNRGTSPLSAFKHCPGDKNAIDRAGMTTLNAGDRIIFRGGTVYRGAVKLKWSGAPGKDIIYDGNSTNSFGIGKAIMDGDNRIYPAAFDLQKKEGFVDFSKVSAILRKVGFTATPSILAMPKKAGFMTIVNFEIRGYDRYGVYLDSGVKITIKECNVNRISDWNFAQCNGTACNIRYVHNLGVGIYITGASQDIIVDRCNIERTGHGGIKILGNSQNIEVKNCDIHDYIHWMINIAPLSSADVISNISIHSNKLRDLYHYASSWWTSWKDGGDHPDDEKFHPGVGENPHIDGVFVMNPLGGTLDNVRIFNNDFYLDKRFNDHGGTAMVFATHIGPTDTIYIYNNIFQYCYMYQAINIKTFGSGGELHVYNNTFFMQDQDKGAMIISGLGKFYLKNNIFHIENGLALNINNASARQSVKSDYNIFKPGNKNIIFDGSWISSLEQWQKTSGQDRNSQSVAELKFASPQDIQNSSSSDLRLQADSPAVNKGTNLSDHFEIDKAGAKRHRGGPWDAGAYQFDRKAK